ncbi:MAG: copper homeostasis protein CutC [Lentimicrobium sp.]|nr:copper homeostasis protein CutC [Lentimicrobium sp.]
MKTNVQIEVCAASVESALSAEQGGADRIELCSALSEGGLTPSAGMIKYACKNLSIPVFVLIRPRTGDFLYSSAEFETMKEDILTAKTLGAKGIVVGMLNADGSIDFARMKVLMDYAKPMEVTFHRAFDMVKDPFVALEEIINLGCQRILTSGQASSALQGISMLEQIIKKAENRIKIMPGSGINPKNLTQIAKASGAREFHFSASAILHSQMIYKNANATMFKDNDQEFTILQTDVAIVAEMRKLADQLS